jgi:hypothetical protein
MVKSCQKVVKKLSIWKIGCKKIKFLKRVGGEEQEQEEDLQFLDQVRPCVNSGLTKSTRFSHQIFRINLISYKKYHGVFHGIYHRVNAPLAYYERKLFKETLRFRVRFAATSVSQLHF